MEPRYIIFSIFFVALVGIILSCVFPMLHMGDSFSSNCMPSVAFVSVDKTNFLTSLLFFVLYLGAVLAQKLITKNQLTGFLGPPHRCPIRLFDFDFNNPVSGFVLVRTNHRKVF